MSGETVGSRGPGPAEATSEGRLERNRRRRAQAFLATGLRIVTEEGIEALTMARLAGELDTAVGAVYRYYGSKDELVAAIQANAIEQLQRSHDESIEPVVTEVVARTGEPDALVRLVVLGRWLCAASQRYPEEVRLLAQVSARRSSSLTPAAASGLVAPTLAFVSAVAATIDAAAAAEVVGPGEGLARAILWLTAFGGVFVADDLDSYVPSVLGGGRLVRQLNTDLLTGWGASPQARERIDAAIDALPDPLQLAR